MVRSSGENFSCSQFNFNVKKSTVTTSSTNASNLIWKVDSESPKCIETEYLVKLSVFLEECNINQ